MAANSPSTFGSDRPLLFTVEPWKRLGFAVPNFGDNAGTLNMAVWGLADEIGRAQLSIMTHIDAWRTQPPSANTIIRLMKIINRVRDVLAARMRPTNEPLLEGGHATADLRPWNIHPVPYYGSMIVRNRWLSEYNRLATIMLTNLYQHSDNNLPLTVTERLAKDVWQYMREMQLYMGIELLQLPAEDVRLDTFKFNTDLTAGHIVGYKPNDFVINHEALDTPGPIESMPTEDDLRPLFEGIPATMILPHLAQYPVGVNGELYGGQALRPGAEAPGTADGSAVAKPGGTIGQPTI